MGLVYLFQQVITIWRLNMDAIIQIYNDTKGKFRFKLINMTGETIAVSESYATKENALKEIDSVKKNASLTIVEDKTI
jgi:uncharacterized protein YegP (UPF0339 family)